MTSDINNLLTLSSRERRKIAERLWASLSPVNNISKEEQEILDLLEKRWQDVKNGNSRTYTSAQLKKMIAEERSKKK
jgi:putative addiction module component (TIGR02574 family)